MPISDEKLEELCSKIKPVAKFVETKGYLENEVCLERHSRGFLYFVD